jgi:AcrR family transcriptional regulator
VRQRGTRTAKPLDRRVQRTRKLLQDALISMMIEKGYEATTVQDIIDRANVGRATFYAHFADKDTLLASRLEDLRAMLMEQQHKALATLGELGERGLGFSLAMLQHARSHLPLYGMIVGRPSGALVLQRIHRTIADLVALDLKALGFKGTPEQRALATEYIAGAFMAVLTWWVDHGAKLLPEEVDGIFRRLVMPGLAAELELRPKGQGKSPTSEIDVRLDLHSAGTASPGTPDARLL